MAQPVLREPPGGLRLRHHRRRGPADGHLLARDTRRRDITHTATDVAETAEVDAAPIAEPSAQRFAAGEASHLAQFGQYLVEGIWHIWIGFDHILFLLSLLLPAVLVHEARRWRGVASFHAALVEVLWVVTAFTVAHSITLSLAALGLIDLPSRLVESAIAAQWRDALARRFRNTRAPLANPLLRLDQLVGRLPELGLPQETLVLSLLGFNLGVEVGQLAIVAVFLPFAWFLRDTPLYRRGIFVGGSLLTLAIALVWFVERAFDLKLISA